MKVELIKVPDEDNCYCLLDEVFAADNSPRKVNILSTLYFNKHGIVIRLGIISRSDMLKLEQD